MARKTKANQLATPTTAPTVKESDPLPNWPSSTMVAFGAGLVYLLQHAGTLLELASSPVAAYLREQNFNVVEHPLPLTQQSYTPESFDAIYSVHITAAMHDFPALVAEIKQLLRPDTFYADLTSIPSPSDDVNHLNVGWETILKRNQVINAFRLAKRPRVEFDNALTASGATCEMIPICRWMEDYSPRKHYNILSAQKSPLPAEIYKRCLVDYERWLKAHYSDLDQPMQQQHHGSIQIWRWVS